VAEAEAALAELLDRPAAPRDLGPGDAFDEGLDDYRRLIATTGQMLLLNEFDYR
jgi:hypothetical protein